MLIFLTIFSVSLAVVMSVFAWRATREERRRSNARVAALAREIHGDAPPRPADLDLRSEAPHDAIETVASSSGLFAAAEPSGSRWGLALAAGALVVATIAAIVVVFGGESAPATERPTARATVAASDSAPIELVALGHERDGDILTVRGVIRNPPNGSEKDRLTAVVSLFGRDGGFLTSGRAAVESSALIPGGESRFVVTVSTAADVGRYRVSFQADDHVVSHVDRRSIS